MKKLFVSILALAAFAACQSNFDDVTTNTPGLGEDVLPEGMIRTYAEVGVGEEGTKATYTGTKATWEAGDQIALLQENANLDAAFTKVNTVPIKSGAGTNSATFSGDITVLTESPRIYHIAYPASAVSFSTLMTQSVAGVSYTYTDDSNMGNKYKATGYGVCTYNSTLSITVPTTQSGKWEPYMYASTSEAVNSNAIGANTLKTLTGAIAIRAYKADGKTPKQLRKITITSSNAAIAGAFSGTAQSVGNTATITGDESVWWVAGYGDEAKAEALTNLTNALKNYEATSTSATKAMSLSFKGSDKEIVATNLEAIASEADGNYTYHINIAPATFAANTLTIEATDTDGSTLTRVVDKNFVVAASHRAGISLTWESATLKGATVETWYNDWNNEESQFSVLEGSRIYVDNVSVEGNISANQVLAIGVKINGTFHEASQQSGVLAISPITISGLSSGVYKVQPVAKVLLNGEEKWLECSAVEKTVTAKPQVTDYIVRTSYSSNGSVFKTNEIDGNLLKIKANISDSYVANNLVDGKTVTICYGSKTTTTTLGEEKEIPLSYGEWGQYVCYVKVLLKNGYEVVSNKYTTHVTGIPYSISLANVSAPSGWSASGTANSKYLCLKEGTAYVVSMPFGVPATCDVTVTIPIYAYGGSLPNKYKPTVYACATSSTSGSKAGVSTTLQGIIDMPKSGTESYTDWKPNLSLSNTAPRVSIYADGSKYWSSTTVSGYYIGVIMKSIDIKYKE